MALGKVAENMTVCLSGRQLSKTRITCTQSFILRWSLLFPAAPEVQSPCQTFCRPRQESSSLSGGDWSPAIATSVKSCQFLNQRHDHHRQSKFSQHLHNSLVKNHLWYSPKVDLLKQEREWVNTDQLATSLTGVTDVQNIPTSKKYCVVTIGP